MSERMKQWSPTEGELTRRQISLLDQRTRGAIGSTEFERRARRSGIKNPERLLGEYQRGEIKWQIPIEVEYTETEYTRYYKYLPSEKYKQRHFEARGTFTVPQGIDPDGQKVYNMIERIFDVDVMAGTLGIQVDDNWEIDWISGAEEKGKTDSFNRSVEVVVVDKLRPTLGPYRVNVPINEADFGESKEE